MTLLKEVVTLLRQIFTPRKANKGSVYARKIRIEIEGLSPLKLKPTHTTVEGGYDPNYKDEHENLDYQVFYKGRLIAILDTTVSNYTFESSLIMPVRFYKGGIIKRSTVPAFIVICMEKERDPLKDICVWIRGENVIKSPTESPYMEYQDNYYTDKADWTRGLENLVKELLK